MLHALRRRLTRLRRNEDGNVTIEFVMWLPIWLALFGIATDATILMHNQLQLTVAARDATRQVALGREEPEEMAATLRELFDHVEDFDVSVERVGGFAVTTISAPFESFTLFTGLLTGGRVTGSVAMWVEGGAGA